METYQMYWTASLMRGIVAIIAGIAVFLLPQMITLVFLFPFAILLSMLCLAAYGTVDSAIVLGSSFLVPSRGPNQAALLVEGACGVVCGGLLFFLVYDRAQLPWFLYLAAFQAASVAITELVIARSTSVHDGSRWCFGSASIAAVSSIGLLLSRNLGPENVAWVLFVYLSVFGFNLTILSARMLFSEYRVNHVIPHHSSALAAAR